MLKPWMGMDIRAYGGHEACVITCYSTVTNMEGERGAGATKQE